MCISYVISIYIYHISLYICFISIYINYIYIIISICPGFGARHEAATSREAVGVTLDVCRRDLANGDDMLGKYGGMLVLCFVSSAYDIWRYMEIYVL